MESARKVIEVNVYPKIIGADEAKRKAEELVRTINSAKSLAGELAELCKQLMVEVTVD